MRIISGGRVASGGISMAAAASSMARKWGSRFMVCP
jgi:hypothetical protein